MIEFYVTPETEDSVAGVLAKVQELLPDSKITRVIEVSETVETVFLYIMRLQARAKENPKVYADKILEYEGILKEISAMAKTKLTATQQAARAMVLHGDMRTQLAGTFCCIRDGRRWLAFAK